MNVISINDKSAVERAIIEIHQHPILVQLPSVFGILAAPTTRGAQQLDRVKARQADKNYGTLIGSLDKFIAQAKRDYLPDSFSSANQFTTLDGTFVRLPFRDRHFQSKAIKDGTHQGLLLSGVYSTLFSGIEASFEGYPPDKLWNYANYCAPLGTSCNISGDPEGSIVTFEKALSFAKARGIKLILTTTDISSQKGSYPILGFEKHKVIIHRKGPSLDSFKAQIPAYLRTW